MCERERERERERESNGRDGETLCMKEREGVCVCV